MDKEREDDLTDWILYNGETVAMQLGLARDPASGEYSPEDLQKIFDECERQFIENHPAGSFPGNA